MKNHITKDLSIVLPVYNEAENLDDCYQRLLTVLDSMVQSYELIFVNDGSLDNSLDIIREFSKQNSCVKYIDLSRNFGQQAAITAGLEKVTGNRVVVMDADLQDPPELLIEMYSQMEEGFNVVYAKRKKRRGESILKRLTAKMFYRILAKMTKVKIPLDTGDFRMMDKKVVDVLKNMPERDRFIRGQVAWIGFRQTFVEYTRDSRSKGKSAWSYKKMFRFALDGMTSFSDFPLRFASYLGFVVSFVSFFLILWALYQRLISHSYVQGWTSLILCILFFGGIQLMSIGIIGEYISRIGSNVRRRPVYIVNETNVDNEKMENKEISA